MAEQNQYILERTMHFPNMTVRVHRPVLTKEERAARMRQIYNAAANLLVNQTMKGGT
jgi:hypothetical protein